MGIGKMLAPMSRKRDVIDCTNSDMGRITRCFEGNGSGRKQCVGDFGGGFSEWKNWNSCKCIQSFSNGCGIACRCFQHDQLRADDLKSAAFGLPPILSRPAVRHEQDRDSAKPSGS